MKSRIAVRPNRAAGLFFAAAFVAMLGTFVVPASAGVSTSAITVTQVPAADQSAPCLPGLLALSNVVGSDAATFTLVVTASAPLCDPVEVKAVVYAMPGNGVAWPQNLVEVKPFTISQAGVTTITFAKGCDPVQFDVLTGVTPQTISPTGTWHGPLLFPLDTGTAQQFFGTNAEGCNPTTTTSTSTTTLPTNGPTTTSTTTSTTTTVPGASVLGETTVVTTTTAAAPAGVLAETATKAPNALAFTGANSGTTVLLGGVLLLAGLVMVMVARRRLN